MGSFGPNSFLAIVSIIYGICLVLVSIYKIMCFVVCVVNSVS